MDPRDEETRFPESQSWRPIDDAAATGRAKLDEIKQLIEGKSPGELFAMAREFVEQRPLQGALVGFGLGFVLGRLLRRS